MRRIQFGIGIGEDANGNPISEQQSDEMIASAMFHLGRVFGGGFITRGQGFWKSKWSDREIIEEGITITIDTDDDDEVIESAAEVLLIIFDQTAIRVYIGSTIQSYDHIRS